MNKIVKITGTVIYLAVMYVVVMLPTVIYTWSTIQLFSSNMIIASLHFTIFILSLFAVSIKLGEYVFRKIFLSVILAFVLHSLIFFVDSGRYFYEPAMLGMLFPYFVFTFLSGITVNTIIAKKEQDRIKKKLKQSGIDAVATIIKAYDMGERILKGGVNKEYKMKLTLRIENHPKSPYEITGIYWVNEFFIHHITSGEMFEIKVDKNNHKLVALPF